MWCLGIGILFLAWIVASLVRENKRLNSATEQLLRDLGQHVDEQV